MLTTEVSPELLDTSLGRGHKTRVAVGPLSPSAEVETHSSLHLDCGVKLSSFAEGIGMFLY
jgi:hypothetical protein